MGLERLMEIHHKLLPRGLGMSMTAKMKELPVADRISRKAHCPAAMIAGVIREVGR
jgi:hypothetical protein